MLVEMQLQELRKSRNFTQVEVAHALNVEQTAVSKLERREDMFVSTLRDYVKALGESYTWWPRFQMPKSGCILFEVRGVR